MDITRLDTMQSINRVSKVPFSNSRITLADFHVANTFLNELISELNVKRFGFLGPPWNVLVQQTDKCEGGLSLVELRTLRDVCQHSGANKVEIVEKEYPITKTEAKNYYHSLIHKF